MSYKPISGIYIITCLINNKVYIGRANSLKSRLAQHLRELKGNYHHNIHLQRAWNKYGEENFTFELLEEYESEFLPSMENWWCNMLQAHNPEFGYNMEPTNPYKKVNMSEQSRKKISLANKGKKRSQETKKKISDGKKGKPSHMKGKTHTKETKDKISKATKGKIISEEQKEKNRIGSTGRKHTKESKEKMSKSAIGKKMSIEARKNLSIAKKGKKLSEEHKKVLYQPDNRKKVINTITKEILNSISELEKILGYNKTKLSYMLNNKIKNTTDWIHLKNYKKDELS